MTLKKTPLLQEASKTTTNSSELTKGDFTSFLKPPLLPLASPDSLSIFHLPLFKASSQGLLPAGTHLLDLYPIWLEQLPSQPRLALSTPCRGINQFSAASLEGSIHLQSIVFLNLVHSFQLKWHFIYLYHRATHKFYKFYPKTYLWYMHLVNPSALHSLLADHKNKGSHTIHTDEKQYSREFFQNTFPLHFLCHLIYFLFLRFCFLKYLITVNFW